MSHRPKKSIPRRTESGLSPEELEHLISGFIILDGDDPAWATDDAERRQIWETHKTFIMSLQGEPCKGESFAFQRGNVYFAYGTRPSAWWDYDAPEPRVPGESEAAYLRCHNLLTQEESARGGETAEESSVLVDVRQRKTR